MNQTLYNLVKNKDIIFVIGPMGSGKTVMADQINTADYESGGRGYEIIDNIMSLTDMRRFEHRLAIARHQGQRYIITTTHTVSRHCDFNNDESIAWIFVGVNGYHAYNYTKYIHRSLLQKLAKKYYNTLKNKRKTRPYLLVQNNQLRDDVHFGRFKQSNRLL